MIAGIIAFVLQFGFVLVIRRRLGALARKAAGFLGQPVEATYVIAVTMTVAVALAVRYPNYSLVGLAIASIPLWLRNRSVAATLFWVIAALPVTFYSLLASLAGVGVLTLPLTLAMWRTANRHRRHDPSLAERTPRRALMQFYWGGIGAILALACLSLVVTGGEFPARWDYLRF